MLTLQGVSYSHPNKDVLLDDIHLTLHRQEKIALIGNNGAGKSTLLKILAGILQPSKGTVKVDARSWYVPQLVGQFNDHTIAEALQIDEKLNALQQILRGNVTNENMTLLDDDWAIGERCLAAFAHWQLEGITPDQKISTLSGGQKTKVFLAGILIHQPQIVLLDEPSNHLDVPAREILYQYIRSTNDTLVVVSHDRTLLNLLNTVCELSKRGIMVYGGNYEFYAEQKQIESNALDQEVKSKEKSLRKAKETEREAMERQQKLDARGRKKQEKAGLPTILMNTLRNNAEKSTARMKGVHTEKVDAISQELNQLRKELPAIDQMKIGFDNSALHKGKILFTAKDLNFRYDERSLWETPLNFQINSGERLSIKGFNGSGKTTIIKMLLGKLAPTAGALYCAENIRSIYIDQDYSLIDEQLTVYEQVEKFNTTALQEHEVKIRLNRFLFTKEYWDKPCKALSGGEKMRLMLCCLTVGSQSPDLIVLDEPTNNLDIQNLEILTAAINEYKGTLIVISHDAYFLEQIKVEDAIVVA